MLTKGLSVDKDNLSKVLYNYLKGIQIDYTTVKGVLIGAKNIDDMVKQYIYLIGNLDMTDVKVGGYILHSLNTLGVKYRLKRSMVYKGYKVPTPIYIIKVLGINIHTNDTSLVVNLYKNEVNIKVKSVRTFIEGKGVVDVLDCYGLTIESMYKSIDNLIEKYGKL